MEKRLVSQEGWDVARLMGKGENFKEGRRESRRGRNRSAPAFAMSTGLSSQSGFKNCPNNPRRAANMCPEARIRWIGPHVTQFAAIWQESWKKLGLVRTPVLGGSSFPLAGLLACWRAGPKHQLPELIHSWRALLNGYNGYSILNVKLA